MRNSLIVMSRYPGLEPIVLNVNEIRQIEFHQGKSRVTTGTGAFIADESIAEIMTQYRGDMSAIFDTDSTFPKIVGPLCDDCKAKAESKELVQSRVSPSLQDMMNTDMSVRARNVFTAAFPAELKVGEEGTDATKIPLTPILGITEDEWAARRNSSRETAREIIVAISAVTGTEEAA